MVTEGCNRIRRLNKLSHDAKKVPVLNFKFITANLLDNHIPRSIKYKDGGAG